MTDSRLTLNPDPTPPVPMMLVLAGGVAAISFGAVFIRVAQDAGMPSLLIASLRLVIAALLITPATLRHHSTALGGLTRRGWGLAAFSGAVLAVHFASWVTSLEYTTVLVSVTLVTTTPIWTALIEVVVLKGSLSRGLIIGLIVALVGGVLVGIPSGEPPITPAGSNILLGGGLALLGAVTVGVYLIIGRVMRSDIALLPYIWIVYGMAGFVLLMGVITQGIPLLGYSLIAYGAVFANAIIPQLIGHTALNYAVKYASPTYVTIATKLEPIGSAVLAFFMFQELPTTWQVIGSAVILVGVLFASEN